MLVFYIALGAFAMSGTLVFALELFAQKSRRF